VVNVRTASLPFSASREIGPACTLDSHPDVCLAVIGFGFRYILKPEQVVLQHKCECVLLRLVKHRCDSQQIE
jgi:hypothetical protein